MSRSLAARRNDANADSDHSYPIFPDLALNRIPIIYYGCSIESERYRVNLFGICQPEG
jgi:hypothetical protein